MPTILDYHANVRTGSYELAADGLSARKRFTDEYLVRGDSHTDNEDTILATAGLPGLWSPLRGAFVRRMSAKETDTHARIWTATYDYDSQFDSDNDMSNGGGGGGGGGGLPDMGDPDSLDEEPEWDSEEIEEVIENDQVDTDKPIANIHKEPYLCTRMVPIPVLSLTRYQSSFSESTIYNYQGYVNSTSFMGFPAKTALMSKIHAVKTTLSNGAKWWKVTYVIKFNKKKDKSGGTLGWMAEFLHEGTFYTHYDIGDPPSLIRPIPFLDANKNRIRGNLDSIGDKAAPGSEMYLKFNRFPATDFGPLSL